MSALCEGVRPMDQVYKTETSSPTRTTLDPVENDGGNVTAVTLITGLLVMAFERAKELSVWVLFEVAPPSAVAAALAAADSVYYNRVVIRLWDDKASTSRSGRHSALVFSLTMKALVIMALLISFIVVIRRSTRRSVLLSMYPLMTWTLAILAGTWISAFVHDLAEAFGNYGTADVNETGSIQSFALFHVGIGAVTYYFWRFVRT